MRKYLGYAVVSIVTAVLTLSISTVSAHNEDFILQKIHALLNFAADGNVQINGGLNLKGSKVVRKENIFDYRGGAKQQEVYYHIRTPEIKGCHEMYRYDLEGYFYGAAQPLSLTWVGFLYAAYRHDAPYDPLRGEGSTNNIPGSTVLATQYIGNDGHLYLRFGPIFSYCDSFILDCLSDTSHNFHQADKYSVILTSSNNLLTKDQANVETHLSQLHFTAKKIEENGTKEAGFRIHHVKPEKEKILAYKGKAFAKMVSNQELKWMQVSTAQIRTKIKPNTQYFFSIHTKSPTNTINSKWRLSVNWFSGVNQLNDQLLEEYCGPAIKSWTLLSGILTSPANADYVTLYLKMIDVPKDGELWMDAAEILEVIK